MSLSHSYIVYTCRRLIDLSNDCRCYNHPLRANRLTLAIEVMQGQRPHAGAQGQRLFGAMSSPDMLHVKLWLGKNARDLSIAGMYIQLTDICVLNRDSTGCFSRLGSEKHP